MLRGTSGPIPQSNNPMHIFMMSMFGNPTNYIPPNQNNQSQYFPNYSNFQNNPPQNIQNNIYPGINDDSWKVGYTAYNPLKRVNTGEPMKLNCIFKTTQGQSFNIPFSEERTVEDLILTFFRRVDREILFKEGGIAFLYNAEKMEYHNQQKIKQFFKTNFNPVIMVIDIKNLIGA